MCTQHLNHVLSCHKLDDKDALRQLRLLYAKSNSMLGMFQECSYEVMFYYPNFWTHYKKSTHSKLSILFNNVYQRMLKLSPRSSASNNIDNFKTLLRKRTFKFIEKLVKSENSIIECLTNSWIIKFDVWNCWSKILFTN